MIKIEELSPPERIAAKMFQEVIPKGYVLGIILSICAIVIGLIYGMSGILIGIIDMIFDTSFLASLENFGKQYYDIFGYIIMIPLCLIVGSFVIIWNSLRFWVIHFEKTVEDILSSTHDNFPEIVSKMEKIRRQMYFYRPVQILIGVCASPKSFTLLQSYLHECIQRLLSYMMLLREKLGENIKSQMSLTKNAEHELLSLQSNVPGPYEVVHLQKERLVLLSLQFEKILQRLESPQNGEKKS